MRRFVLKSLKELAKMDQACPDVRDRNGPCSAAMSTPFLVFLGFRSFDLSFKMAITLPCYFLALANQYANSLHLHSGNIQKENSFSLVDFGKSSSREIICGVAIIASAIYGLMKCKHLIEPAIASMTLVLLTKFNSYYHSSAVPELQAAPALSG